MIRKISINVSSPEFGWTTPQGLFVGRAHATFQHSLWHGTVFAHCAPIMLRIYVYRVSDDGGGRTHFHLWESREIAKRDGNALSELDAWRMHATGYTPDVWVRAQVSFQRENARWKTQA